MTLIPEPIPVGDDNAQSSMYFDSYLRDLFATAQNLSLTSRDGTIANNDKAGNLNAVYVVFTSNGVANTEDTVAHTLGRVPLGYIPVKQDASAVLYDGTTTWTTTNIYFRTSAATVAWTVMLF